MKSENKLLKPVLVSLCCSLLITNAFAAQATGIAKTDTAPLIDGNLTESCWKNATLFTEFRTMKPDYGRPPSEKTNLYLLYDQDRFYVGIEAFDSNPQKIKATMARRDSSFNDDWVAFCLDTLNDELNAYFFAVNPFGIQADGTLDSNADPDITLDMLWRSAGRLTEKGYVVEMAIPFKSLRFPHSDAIIMGFKAARNISRKSEEVDFPEYSPARGGALSQFHKIRLSGVRQTKILEVLPAVTFSQRHFREKDTMVSSGSLKDLGLTAKFGLSSSLVLDAAYNPDFSQVETDAGQIDVNLRYSNYYPEKRPFFMEGQENFGFGAQQENAPLGAVVHTRNIVDPVIGLKLNGKLGEKNILSAFYAMDDYPEEKTHFSIIRYGRRLTGDSYVGGFYTGRMAGKDSNHVAGADGRIRLTSRSSIQFHGFLSRKTGKDILSPMTGQALGALYSYETRLFEGFIGAREVSRDFRTDVGYLTRTGITQVPMYARYTFHLKSGWLQKIEPSYWAVHGIDHESGKGESFNSFAVRFSMPRQSTILLSLRRASEVFERERFDRSGFRFEGETQIFKELYLSGAFFSGEMIYYDPFLPFQGRGTQAELSIQLQPTGNLSSRFDFTYADFFRKDSGDKVYDYLIFRNRTIYQLNRYLFIRSVLEYNTHWRRLNADFLASFTYIPGTVIHAGYGSVYERSLMEGDSLLGFDDSMRQMQRSFFFKASYLLRF